MPPFPHACRVTDKSLVKSPDFSFSRLSLLQNNRFFLQTAHPPSTTSRPSRCRPLSIAAQCRIRATTTRALSIHNKRESRPPVRKTAVPHHACDYQRWLKKYISADPRLTSLLLSRYGGGYQQQGHGAPHQNYGPPQQGGYYNQGYNQGPPVRFNEAHGRQRVGEGWKY